MNIDANSLTWKTILKFAEDERNEAIKSLIADSDSEQQRGAIAMLDRLVALTEEEPTPVVSIRYDV